MGTIARLPFPYYHTHFIRELFLLLIKGHSIVPFRYGNDNRISYVVSTVRIERLQFLCVIAEVNPIK